MLQDKLNIIERSKKKRSENTYNLIVEYNARKCTINYVKNSKKPILLEFRNNLDSAREIFICVEA